VEARASRGRNGPARLTTASDAQHRATAGTTSAAGEHGVRSGECVRYSNHSNGRAVDFNMFLGAKELRASKAQRSQWRGTWLHDWLREHAGEFGFVPLSTEEWHWDYK